MIFYGVFIVLVVLYVWLNDRAISHLPPKIRALAPRTWTSDDFERVVKELEKKNDPMEERKRAQTPPKTGRRYIVTGGSGFLGGWIVMQLLQRGENPKNIRILDVRPPTRRDLTAGKAKEVQFVKVDVTDKSSVEAAFEAPWLQGASQDEITVFHVAAVIRFHERHRIFLGMSEKVNVQGTQNVIDAARKIGVTVLVATSSGSVAQWKPGSLLMWPWQWPWVTELLGLELGRARLIQVLGDQEAGGENEASRGPLPRDMDDFCTLYSYTKLIGERLVREADKSPTGSAPKSKLLRTGCLRPINSIYGPGSDVYDYYLGKGENNISLADHSVGNHIHVENCVLAHLLYEKRLMDSAGVDVGGQAFTVTDPGPISSWPNTHRALAYFTNHFSQGRAQYRSKLLSTTTLAVIASVVETYYVSRFLMLGSSSSLLRSIGKALPPVTAELARLQPSTLYISTVHPLVDDSRARLPAEKGGLGYVGVVETMEGVARCTREFFENGRLSDQSMFKFAEATL
ncbi:hypothetical protein V5O48_005898 [Marasmius crinis-equi]|uniref:3-beta hydroxysteroid dehydrogenase/isomerase domain-containing protein n=1 Tax=Marasmius crinis-equi TaxID=585013 RepID=A0ABR3FL01_9AGAR